MDIPRFLKLGDDSDRRSFCYPHRDGDVAHPHLWVSSEADDDVAMITEEGPAARRVLGSLLELT